MHRVVKWLRVLSRGPVLARGRVLSRGRVSVARSGFFAWSDFLAWRVVSHEFLSEVRFLPWSGSRSRGRVLSHMVGL